MSTGTSDSLETKKMGRRGTKRLDGIRLRRAMNRFRYVSEAYFTAVTEHRNMSSKLRRGAVH